MTDFLDMNVISNVRKAVNNSNLLSHDEHYNKTDYNLICAVMDRVDTCVKYLNNHAKAPIEEEDFIAFLMFASMLIDAVKKSFKQLKVDYPYTETNKSNISFENNPQYYTYFRDICMDSKLKINKENCPSDDKFFEYFRSLSFAHPVETSRAKFLQEGEMQYSPWIIVCNPTVAFDRSSDYVGIRIYSNKSDGLYDFTFSFSILKEYINSRYALIEKITEKILTIIENQEIKWKERKINRSLSPVETLQDIQSILEERHEKDMVEDMITYLSCKLSNSNNQQSVDNFREALLNVIPQLCDAIDDMDYEKAYDIIEISQIKPKKSHSMFPYQMEKIFCCLRSENDENNIQLGLQQANTFAQKFAKIWVTIDVNSMSFDEIKLLVQTACYLEWLKQEESK